MGVPLSSCELRGLVGRSVYNISWRENWLDVFGTLVYTDFSTRQENLRKADAPSKKGYNGSQDLGKSETPYKKGTMGDKRSQDP